MNIFKKYIWVGGFAIFTMFFGSGNLVFPILVGSETQNIFLWGALGLVLSGVFMPLAGLLGMSLFNGNRKEYFSSLGIIPAAMVVFVLLALLGPIGVGPRSAIVAYSGFKQLVPGMSESVFSALFCVAIGLMIWDKGKIVSMLGVVFTPLLLGSIGIIIVAGLFFTMPVGVSDYTVLTSLKLGILEGYQTMDLLAAFFFGMATIQYIQKSMPENSTAKDMMKSSLAASIVGASLLVFVYVAFIFLGAKFSDSLQGNAPGEYLILIAQSVLGAYSVPVISVTFVVACITTAAVTISLFVDFIYSELLNNMISRGTMIIVSLIITFVLSLLSFDTMRQTLGAIVQVLYPALIAFAIANIIEKLYSFKKANVVFYVVLVVSIILKFVF